VRIRVVCFERGDFFRFTTTREEEELGEKRRREGRKEDEGIKGRSVTLVSLEERKTRDDGRRKRRRGDEPKDEFVSEKKKEGSTKERLAASFVEKAPIREGS